MMNTALNHLFEGFLLAKEAEEVSDRTLETYQLMYHNLTRDLPPSLLSDANSVRATDLKAWVVGLRDRIATATLDQRISKAKTFFRWCRQQCFLEHNPARDLKRPKEDWQSDPLSSEEIHLLLQAAKDSRMGMRNYALVCVLLDSGMRNRELCALHPEDVSLKTGQIKIHKAKGGKARTVLVGKLAKEAL
jgi:site-specific recombinase XerD